MAISCAKCGWNAVLAAGMGPSRCGCYDNLRGASDAELRAECERRFPRGFGVVHEVTLRERQELIEDRDNYRGKWAQEAEDHAACLSIAEGCPIDGFVPTRPSHRAVMELRARAEGLSVHLDNARLTIESLRKQLAPEPRGFAAWLPDEARGGYSIEATTTAAAAMTDDQNRELKAEYARLYDGIVRGSGDKGWLRMDHDRRESGPGIAAAKPDNSVAWLDEDLLCEDA